MSNTQVDELRLENVSTYSGLVKAIHTFSVNLSERSKDMQDKVNNFEMLPKDKENITAQLIESFVYTVIKTRELALRAPVRESHKGTEDGGMYTKAEVIQMVGEEYNCTTCNRLIVPTREWYCENCDAIFHEGCEGYAYHGEGEYPSESAYALCKKCAKPEKEDSHERA